MPYHKISPPSSKNKLISISSYAAKLWSQGFHQILSVPAWAAHPAWYLYPPSSYTLLLSHCLSRPPCLPSPALLCLHPPNGKARADISEQQARVVKNKKGTALTKQTETLSLSVFLFWFITSSVPQTSWRSYLVGQQNFNLTFSVCLINMLKVFVVAEKHFVDIHRCFSFQTTCFEFCSILKPGGAEIAHWL